MLSYGRRKQESQDLYAQRQARETKVAGGKGGIGCFDDIRATLPKRFELKISEKKNQ